MKRLRLFRFRHIHTSIALAFSLLILCTTALLSYNSYRLSAASVTDNSVAYTDELINQVKTNIQTYISNMESISALALSSGQIQQYLSLEEPNANDQAEALLSKQIGSSLHAIVASRGDIATILFVGSNGKVISDRGDAAELKDFHELIAQDWYRKASIDSTFISSSQVEHLYRHEYRWVISMSKRLSGDDGTEGNTGVLLVDLNYNVINDLCRQIHLGQRGYVFIVDAGGDLVYHPQQQIMNTALKSERIDAILAAQDSSVTFREDGRDKIYTIRSTGFGWKVVGVTYPDELVGDKRKLQLSSALWGGLCLVVALGISVLLSLTLSRPIKQLDAKMKQVERGSFDIRVDLVETNEIGKLARTFNLMIAKIKELMEQIVKEQETIRSGEIKALQAQIQPHFLYNTLDSIIWMAETDKMEEVVAMTTALSRLLRASIGKGEEEVPLEVELEHVSNYLMIQSKRYRHKFTYRIDAPPELCECLILKVVLQPLVENAIYHGIKRKAEPGHIRIEVRSDGDALELAVSDDGAGMEPERAKGLLTAAPPAEGGHGVGVRNVNHRIQLYYGTGYGLTFASELEEGTTVTVRIPHRSGKEEGA
jgi:two-component system sensor histidine kinase YesM